MARRLAILLCLLMPAIPGQAGTWTIRADPWCPYNCAPDDARPGYLIEILQHAARDQGQTLDYRLMGWARALDEARLGNITGVVAINDSQRAGLLVSDAVGSESTCLYVREGDSFRFREPADLDRLASVGAAFAYGYTPEIRAWAERNPKKFQRLAGERVLRANVRKLLSKRIQALLENPVVFDYEKSRNPDITGVISAGCTPPSPIYIGISERHPSGAAIVRAINASLARLRDSGELARIRASYGLGE